MPASRIHSMTFASVYPHYVAKAVKKGRTQAEVDQIVRWLTGYTAAGLQRQIAKASDFPTFFAEAPRLNASVHKITGTVCGVRVEAIDDPLVQKVRWLDKLIDELAKGKAMAKILRS